MIERRSRYQPWPSRVLLPSLAFALVLESIELLARGQWLGVLVLALSLYLLILALHSSRRRSPER